MLDTATVELCARCLADAAAFEGDDSDFALTATALTRDIADTHPGGREELLDAALRAAVPHLDDSDLDAPSFAAALRRLAGFRGAAHRPAAVSIVMPPV
ncbi:MAG: hypothetical protein ABSH51_20085 [Solirubrobacteraceae bacterium]